MRIQWLASITVGVGVSLAVMACAPAATPSPTAAPKPTESAKPAAAGSPAAGASPAAAASPSAAASPAAAAPAAAKPVAAPSGPPVKVGFLAPLSGPVAVYGGILKYAPLLAVREINESGGINGSPLELVTVDSPNNPNQTVTGVRRLANEDRVAAILGPYFTGEMQVAAPLGNELKTPIMAYQTAGSHPGAVDKSDWVFLANSSEEISSQHALDGFKKVYPSVKKIVVAGDNQSAVTAITLKDVWPKILPAAGYEIVDTVTFQFATSDFSPIATRIKASGAEGIAISALSPAGPNLLKELERQGIKLPVVYSSHLQTVPPVTKLYGSSVEGMVQTYFVSPEKLNDPNVKAWVDKYVEVAVADNPGAERPIIGFASEPQVYDAFHIVARAMRDAGITGSTPPAEAREKTRDALRNIKDFPGILGTPKSINAENRITTEFFPLLVKNGELVDIK